MRSIPITSVLERLVRLIVAIPPDPNTPMASAVVLEFRRAA